MELRKIPADSSVFPLGQGRSHHADTDRAVLLLHGFRGLAGEFSYLFDRLKAEGYALSLPRLPGHGTNRNDFHQSGRRDWLRCALDSYLDLKSRYSRVFIAGLSMGGLLTLLLAEQLRPDKIALLAPALGVNNRLFYTAPLIRPFLGRIKSGWSPREEESEERRAIGREYWESYDTAKLCDLIVLMRRARKNLGNVVAPTLTIVSQGDKTVPLSVADTIEGTIRSENKKRVVLEKSPHVLVDGCEKEAVADEVIAWFKG